MSAVGDARKRQQERAQAGAVDVEAELDEARAGVRAEALDCERPRDINLVKHRLQAMLHEHPDRSVILSAEEGRTLMRSITDADRRLCSD